MNDTYSAIKEFVAQANPQVATAAKNSRVAARFLPTYKLPRTAKNVTADTVNTATGDVDDVTTVPLAEIWVSFPVDWQQLSAPGLVTALGRAQDAARYYSRVEDRLLFLGQAVGPPGGPPLQLRGGALRPGARVDRGSANQGLSRANSRVGRRNDIYDGIARAYRFLEEYFPGGPFAIAMGAALTDEADRTPMGFVESPLQRIENLLGSTVHRSSVLDDWTAILLAGAKPHDVDENLTIGTRPAGPVDRAVAVFDGEGPQPWRDVEIRDLRTTDAQGRHLLWVHGVVALGFKDRRGVLRIDF